MSTPLISDAESVVMAILWQRHPATAEDIIGALEGEQDWQDATIKTLLNRLLNKGAIRADKDGRRYLYAPVLQREEWLAQQSESLLDRWFGGRVAPLVAHFSKQRKLSERDIAELKALIEGMRDDQ